MDSHSKPSCCRVSLAEICSLYQKLFQTPADMRSVQAAVDKVCGTRPHSGFCCSSKLLDVLVEVERQRWVKEQIYWDFQLLDFNRDSSLSLSDVKILLQKAQESQVTSMSWVDFLTQRQETSNRVTWAELEAWLFETASPMRYGTLGASNAQISFHENDQLQYQGEMMNQSKRLKDQWDTRGLEVVVRAAEETMHARSYPLTHQMDLSEAVNHKYAALNEKLFCDMLQAHYGSQVWASMNNGQKEQNMNELKMLVEFGLERGSELVLSQLPGAAHNFRDEESSCSCEEAKKTWTAVQGLKELQRRLELERSSLSSYNEGQSDSVCHAHQYLLLFAQKIKVKMECNFSAALLVVEPYWKQRFWNEKPVCLETCFEELAHIRLTTGQKMKQKLEKEQLGSKQLSVEEDKLLSLLKRQEEARDLLFQLLQSCSHEELQEPLSSLLHNTSEENLDPVKEVSNTKVERNPLRQLFLLAMTVTKTCLLEDREMVTWGDCAVRLLVQVQLKQELELRELILELSRGVDNDDQSVQRTKEPVLEGNDPVSYLIHLLQPITPKEQFNLEQFKAELVSSLEWTKLHEKQDKNIKETPDNQRMMVNINKQGENKTSLNDNDTNIIIVDQQKKDVLKNTHIKRPEECAMSEKPQEKIHRRQTVLKEHEKEPGHEWGSSRKESNLLVDTPYKGSITGNSKVAKSMQNEECKQSKHKHVEQIPSDELASSVMEATENLIAGLMTLKAKVEEVYMRRETDQHSPTRMAESDTKALSGMPKKGMDIQKKPKTMERPPLKNTGESLIPNDSDNCNISCYNNGELLIQEDVAEKGILHQRSISCGEGKERQGKELCDRHKEISEEVEDDRKDQLQVSCDERMDENKTLGGEIKCNIPGDSLQTLPANLSLSVMEAAESLIVSLKALKEEISHAAKSQMIEHSGEPIMGNDSTQQKSTEVASRTDCETKPFSNVENVEDSKKNDGSVGVQSDLVPGPMTREISWELHPQCSQGCSHAKIWNSEVRREHFSGEVIAGTDCSAVSENTSPEDKRESGNCGFKRLDEKTKTLLPEPLAQSEGQAADTEYMPHTSAEKKLMTDCHREDDQKFPLIEEVESGENSSTMLKEARDDIAVSTLDSLSEDSSPEQGSADKLAMSFLEAAQNLIGELIPGKEEAGLSSVRRVVVILTDSENGDLILGQGEEVSEVSGTISSLEESSAGESQVSLSKDDEETDDHSHVPVSSNNRDSWELHADCVLSGNHANQWEDCPEGEPSTKLMEVNRQPPIPDTEDAEQVTCHSQACDGIGKSQCRKRAESKNEDQINKLTSEKHVSLDDFGAIKEENPQLPSKVETITEGNFLPTDTIMGDNNIRDMEAPLCNKEQTIKNENKNNKGDNKTTLNPRQKSDSGNNTMNVATSERGDPLTQAEAGIDDTMMTDRGAEDAAEEHYKEQGKDEETETGVTNAGNFKESKSVHSGDVKQMNVKKCLCTGQDYITNEDKDDETNDCKKLSQSELCPYEGSPGTLVNSFLFSSQDLIGSLTSLKEKLGKNDKILRSVETDSNKLIDRTNEQKKSDIHEESCSQSCDSLSCKSIIESTPNMLQNLSYVSANSEDHTVQKEDDPSARIEKMDHNAQQDDKEGPIIGDSSNKTIFQEHGEKPPTDNKHKTGLKEERGQSERALFVCQKATLSDCSDRRDYNQCSSLDFQKSKVPEVVESSWHGGNCQEKECLSHSTYRNRDAEGMALANEGHRDWKKKWRSVCEQQMDKQRKCDDNSKPESSISKRIKIQIIEKSKSESVCYKQRLRPPSPITTVLPESELQEKITQTSSRHENMENGEHMDGIQGKEGDLVTQNKTTRTEQTYNDTTATMCGNNNEQGSLKDLTISLLETTNTLIGTLASLKRGLGRSQESDSFVPCKEITENVQDIKEQRFDVEATDGTPVSLMMETEDSTEISDIQRNGNSTIMGISTKKAEYCQTMNIESMNIRPIQETNADDESRGGIQTQHSRPEEKGESSEVVFSITSNCALIQSNVNQGEHCHMQKDTQLKISAHSVETHQTGNTETTQMQFENKTQIFQEEMGLKAQVTDEPLSKWKSIVMRKIKVSSEHTICEIHKIKFGSVKSEPLTSGNNKEDVNVDPLKQTENELNEEKHQDPDREKVEQINGPEMKDLEEMQTLRSYIRNGVIKRKRENAEEREEEKLNKENKKQSNEKNHDELKRPGATTFSDMYQGVGSKSSDLHQFVSFDDGWLDNKESLKVNVKYRGCEADAMLKGSVTEETLKDYQMNMKDINAEEKRFDSQTGTEHPMELSQVSDPYTASGEEAERQSMAIIKEKESPWLKFWEVANQTVAVAAVSTTQSSNFFGHMAQVPANGVLVRNEKQLSCPLRTFNDAQVKSSTLQNISEASHGTKKQECAVSSYIPQICSLPPDQAVLQREKVFIRLSLREQQEAMQRLTDLQREAELKCASDRRRQMLRFQERLSIAQNRKSELDLMDITQKGSPQMSPEPLAEGDVERQKSAVKEHLEKVKRERTYIMQTRRDRNMTSFRELLDPVLTGKKREDSESELREVEGL